MMFVLGFLLAVGAISAPAFVVLWRLAGRLDRQDRAALGNGSSGAPI